MTDGRPRSDHRKALDEAVRRTIAAGSARVAYKMEANPAHLADYQHGEGVADFRRRRSRAAYYVGEESEHGSVLEQVIDRDVTYLRIGGPDAEWERAELGEPDEFGTSGDAGGFLDLLGEPGEVRLLGTADAIGSGSVHHYALTIQAPKSSLRDRLARGFGVRGPTRFWIEAWIDADGLVRRIATCDHEPHRDGGLRRGSVRTIVDFDDLGAPAPVGIPPTDS